MRFQDEPITIQRAANGYYVCMPIEPQPRGFTMPEGFTEAMIDAAKKVSEVQHEDPLLSKLQEKEVKEEKPKKEEKVGWHLEPNQNMYFFATFREVLEFLKVSVIE